MVGQSVELVCILLEQVQGGASVTQQLECPVCPITQAVDHWLDSWKIAKVSLHWRLIVPLRL
jgi:hypothetical protein